MVCGESQLALRGSGQLRATGIEFKMVCRRTTSPSCRQWMVALE
jgi:hypothetical protein